MNKTGLITVLALLVTLRTAPAGAQTLEFSAGVGAARVDGGEWWGTGIKGPNVTGTIGFAFNERFAVESFLTYGQRSIRAAEYGPQIVGGDTQVTEGIYGVVLRQRVIGRRASGFEAFVNYGLGGMYSKWAVPARQYLNGRTAVTLPAYTTDDTQRMWLPLGGFGVQQAIASHLAIRAEGQVVTFFGIPLGGRGSVGLVVPIGGKSK